MEKLNMKHTEHVNSQDVMKNKSELKTQKGSAGVCNWQSQDDEHKFEPCAVEEYQEERKLPNMDVKNDLGVLLSDNHLPGHNGSFTEKQLRAKGPHLGTIEHTSAVMSMLPLKRSSI